MGFCCLIITLFQGAALSLPTAITNIRRTRERRAALFFIIMTNPETMTTKTTIPLLKAALRLTDKFEPAFKAMEAIVHHARLRVRRTIANQQMISNFTGESGRTVSYTHLDVYKRQSQIRFTDSGI